MRRICPHLCAVLALSSCAAPIDDSGLETEVGQLRRDVSTAVQPILVRDADWRVSVNGSLFREMFRRINALPLDSRTVKLVQSAEASDYLLRGSRSRMSWYVEVSPGRRLWLQTQLLGIEADWLQSGTLQVRADLRANGEIPLHAVFDPGPGPGVGNHLLVSASGQTSVTGTATLSQPEIGKIHYRLHATEPSNLVVQVCIRLKHIGKLCRDAEIDPKLGNALEGDFDLGAETSGRLRMPGQDPIGYRFRIYDAVLTTDSTGLVSQGKVAIEWDR
jgi:hypothetical protein